jgi:ABC-2 type transport system permease protein
MNPVLYDFKRGVLRLSVLLTLLLFTVSGIGLAYLAITSISTTTTSQSAVYYSVIDASTRDYKLEALLLNPDYRPVDGEVSYKLGCYNTTELKRLESELGSTNREEFVNRASKLLNILDEGVVRSVNGRVVVEKNLSSIIEVEYACSLYINTTTPFGSSMMLVSVFSGRQYSQIQVENKTIYVLVETPWPSAAYPIVLTNNSMALTPPTTPGNIRGYVSASLVYITGSDKAKLLLSLYSISGGEFEVYLGKVSANTTLINIPVSFDPGDLEKYFNKVGVVEPGISILEIDTSLFNNTLRRAPAYYFVLYSRGSTSREYTVLKVPVNRVQSGLAARIIYMQLISSVGLGLFTAFFPIIVLYLVYVYIAKPRSQGALEFILARPITRFELYTVRFTAGVLVVAVATSLFYIALMTSINLLTGVSPSIQGGLILYGGLVLSLIAFYSFCYLLGSLTSGSRYIVVSVLSYVLFSILWSLIIYLIVYFTHRGVGVNILTEITRIQYTLNYFNPLRIQDYMQYYFMIQEVGEYSILPTGDVLKEVVNPWLVATSTIAWIIMPFILGWLKFRKASLIS